MPAATATEAVCLDRYERAQGTASAAEAASAAAHRRIDGLVGVAGDGGKGRVGNLEHDVESIAKILERVVEAQHASAIKLAVLVAGASAVGGGIIIAIVTVIKALI